MGNWIDYEAFRKYLFVNTYFSENISRARCQWNLRTVKMYSACNFGNLFKVSFFALKVDIYFQNMNRKCRLARFVVCFFFRTACLPAPLIIHVPIVPRGTDVYIAATSAWVWTLSVSIPSKGPSWSYISWNYNYLFSQCLSPLKLWVRTPFMARCTRYNIMW
jgi:hypothetical protein